MIAVEPGEAMRRAAAPHPRVSWVSGKAEATGLRSQAADLVLCAQSFHWFRVPEALAEFARILKPHRRLAIVWNRRSTTDPLTAGYRQAIVDVGGEIEAERMSFDPDVVAGSGLFSPVERTAFPNFQRLDLDGLIGRAQSASYVPKTGPAVERLLDLLRALHARTPTWAGSSHSSTRPRCSVHKNSDDSMSLLALHFRDPGDTGIHVTRHSRRPIIFLTPVSWSNAPLCRCCSRWSCRWRLLRRRTERVRPGNRDGRRYRAAMESAPHRSSVRRSSSIPVRACCISARALPRTSSVEKTTRCVRSNERWS